MNNLFPPRSWKRFIAGVLSFILIIDTLPVREVFAAADMYRNRSRAPLGIGKLGKLGPVKNQSLVGRSGFDNTPKGFQYLGYMAGGEGSSALRLNPSIVYVNDTWMIEDRNNVLSSEKSQSKKARRSARAAASAGLRSLGLRVAEAIVGYTNSPKIEAAKASLDSFMDGNAAQAKPVEFDPVTTRRQMRDKVQLALSPSAPMPENTIRLDEAFKKAKTTGKMLWVIDTSYATKDPKYSRLPWVPNELPFRTAMQKAFNVILNNREVEAHALVILPTVIPTWYLRHALSLLSPEDAQLVAERLHTVALPGLPNDEYPGNIAWRIMKSKIRDEVIARIKAGEAEFGDIPVIYSSYNIVEENAQLAALMGHPTFSAPPEHDFLGQKSGFFAFLKQSRIRQVLSQLRLDDGEVRITENVGFIFSLRQLVSAVYLLMQKGVSTFWLKTETGVSGMGNGIYLAPMSSLIPTFKRVLNWLNIFGESSGSGHPKISPAASKEEVRAAIESSLHDTKFADEAMTWDHFHDLLSGGVSLEANIPNAKYRIAAPSAGITITDAGPESRARIQEQLLDSLGLFIGMKSPASGAIRASVSKILYAIAWELYKQGNRGPLGLDFMVVPKYRWQKWVYALTGMKVGTFYYYVVEHNQRHIASDSAAEFADGFTGAVTDHTQGIRKLKNGDTVAYLQTVDPTDQDPRLMKPGVEFDLHMFLQGPGGEGNAFDPKTLEGVWRYMPLILRSTGAGHYWGTGHGATEKEAIRRRDRAIALHRVGVGELFIVQRRTGKFKGYSPKQWIAAENNSYSKTNPKRDIRPKLIHQILEHRRDPAVAAFIATANRGGLNIQAAVLSIFEEYLAEAEGKPRDPVRVIPMLTGGYLLMGDTSARRWAHMQDLNKVLTEIGSESKNDFNHLMTDFNRRLEKILARN